MMYNKPNEYKLMQIDSKSMNSGMMTSLVRYENIKNITNKQKKDWSDLQPAMVLKSITENLVQVMLK